MDEILHPAPRPGTAPAHGGLEGLLDGAERLRRRWEGVSYKLGLFFRKFRLRPGVFLLAALLIGGVTTFATVYTKGYAVTVDGTELGVVAEPSQVEAVVDRVEARAGEILGKDYSLPCEITYTPRFVERSTLSDLTGFEAFLFNQVGEVMKTYVLTVDGVELGSLEERDGLDAILEGLKAPYITDNTILSEFTVPVHIDYRYTGTDQLTTAQELREVLTANAVEEATYTVETGDTYSGIAYEHDMSLDELMGMNPGADLKYLYPGDVLTVRQSVPYLSVKTIDRVTYEEAVEPPVEYVDDDTMYKGDTRVIDPGEEGLARVTARITYINGVEDHRDVTQTQELVAPKTKTVAQGTQPRPKTAPTGTFIWPCRGTITSYFGYRSIFGSYSYHQGLDIGVPYYTAIKAADGGTVVWSGYKGSYGNLVIIDHGNGKRSYYGHNSYLLVSAGEKVYQGQAIAKAGSTGNSTGPHCHFEVRLNNTPVDPLNYL